MAVFQVGETIICSITVKDSAETLTDPATSMTISIYDSSNGVDVNNASMAKDSTGKYHYDYTLIGMRGWYKVVYKAQDGARATINKDQFFVE